MAEAQRAVTEGDSEAEEEEVPAQPRDTKNLAAAVTMKGEDSKSSSLPPPVPGSKRSPPPSVPAAYTGPSPTAFQRPSPAMNKGAAPLYTPPAAAPTLTSGVNLFANDGSFMELFKKQMEAKAGKSSSSTGGSAGEGQKEAEKSAEKDKRRPFSIVGKRRGGAKLALKTGIVTKKPKNVEDEVLSNKGGAWAQYMAEVKKYKAHQCSDDDKTRPLVK